MSKRKDLEWASTVPGSLLAERLSDAWELGRIAGIREAAKRVGLFFLHASPPKAIAEDLRIYARRLRQRLK